MKKITSFFENMSLSKQLLFVLLSVPTVLVIILTYYVATQVIHSKNKPKEILALTTSQAVLEKIDRNFYERFGDVQAFAYNRLTVKATMKDSATLASPDFQNFINTMTSYYVLYDLMMICDKDGKVIAVNQQDKAGKEINSKGLLGNNYSNTEWFKTCVSSAGPAGGAWYSDFIINPEIAKIYNSNGHGMAFAAPVKDNDGNVTGVWYNFANWGEVTTGIRKEAEQELQKTEKEAVIIITNNNGEVIDANNESLILTSSLTQDKFYDEDYAGLKLNHGEVLHPDNHITGWGEAKGAYTYKGKNWKAITFLPISKMSIAVFFSKEMLGLVSFVLGCLIVAIILGVRFSKKTSNRINNIKDAVLILSKGELTNTSIHGKDEIGEMAEAVNQLTNGLKQTVRFADNIGKGNLNEEFTALSERDVLGNSLLSMRDNLQRVAIADERRNWANEGFAKFGEILRKDNDNIEKFSGNILSNLIKYTNSNQGSLFIVNETDANNVHLELFACYAWGRKKFLEKKIAMGEGLVGQCWQEQEKIYLTNVPDNYIKITSGIGESNPNCILIIPLKLNEKIFGIIELASFKVFEDYQIDFIERVGESIASTISTAKINDRTKSLLSISQQQAEEMKAQEEEMRQNMEELMATQEESERKFKEMNRVIAEQENMIKNLKSGVTNHNGG